METIIYFLAFCVVTMGLILQFDKKQNVRLNKIVRETKNVQPLFLMRAAEEKLRSLNVKLYGNMVVGPDGENDRVYMNETLRQLASERLTEIVNSYNTGEIQLKEYTVKLSELSVMVNEAKGMNFERASY